MLKLKYSVIKPVNIKQNKIAIRFLLYAKDVFKNDIQKNVIEFKKHHSIEF